MQEFRRLIYKQIDFIDERQIPLEFRHRGFDLTNDIDIKDFVFVSLNEFQESMLWTGDKKLLRGLRKKGYQRIASTEEILQLRIQLEQKRKR